MKTRPPAGFALVITLVLLALLVLAVLALSALTKVSSETSLTGVHQARARQNALLALSVGLGELQRHAGDDARLTGMAGLTGIAPLAANSTRHWCGVWRNDGSFVTWLVSGAQPATAALQAGVPALELISNGTVGAATANSEHVIAGKIAVPIAETPGAPGNNAITGYCAYVICDEGVKTSAFSPPPVVVTPPVIYAATTGNAQGRLRDALATYAASTSKVLSYEQLSLLPTPAAALTPSTLQDNFHHTTLTNRLVSGALLPSGCFNVNTTSAIAWRNLLQTYNTAPGATTSLPSATVSARGTTMQNGLAVFSTPGKAANGPFTSTAAFVTYLATLFPITASPSFTQIMTALGPMLTVRSDTFRIRAYGDALNPADAAKVEAVAYCEAIVQRTPDTMPGFGRRFVITSFRWLGPDDI
ncbi:MAG: hypothetical protein HYX71_01065 [Opitutae bacterium]|nr:hypothetical protein [Opitutae bacterium]